MKEQILAIAKRLWGDFRAFSPGQKAVTIAAALALLVGGVLFFTWKSSPTYAPLYTNLAASDASAIVDKLSTDNIPYKLGSAGTEILVPQSDVYATRLKMSSAGLPSSDQTGYSLLDKEGVTTSQFQQQVDYQRAMEGELAKTIQSMNGVTAASVHLGLPQQNVFNDGTQKPTAAVMLTTSAGTQLSTQQVQSIDYLVSSSIPNMSPDDVTITDSNGQVLSAPGSGVTDASATSTQTQATQAYDNQLAAKLQAILDKSVGPGNAVVTVNAVLNFDKTSTTTDTYVANPSAPPLSQSQTTETYTGSGAGTSGTLGAGTALGATGGSTSGNYKKTSITKDNAVGTQKQTVDSAPGSVKQLAIAVLVNGTTKTINVPAIQSLVQSGAGLNTTRGDTLSVQAMPFNNSAAKQAQQAANAAAKAAAAKASHEHMISLVKQGALAVLVLAVVIGTWLASRKRKNDGDREPLEPMDTFLDESVHLPVAPEPDPVAMANEINEAAARRRALVALADEQPDDVARVLSGWLSREG
jgi:flagellar M-ring protein FliF